MKESNAHTGEGFREPIPGPLSAEQQQLQRAANYYFSRQITAGFRGVSLDPTQSGHLLGMAVANTYGLTAEDTRDLTTIIKGVPDLESALPEITRYLSQHLDVRLYEANLRQLFVEGNNLNPLNETWSYHTEQDVLFLHLAPSRTLTEDERREQQRLAFSHLAEVLADSESLPEVERIILISELMASPKFKALAEAAGFRVLRITDTETLERYPPKHRHRVFLATTDRAEFIESARS